MLLNLNLQLDTSSSPITPLHPPSTLTSTSSSSSSNPSRTLSHSRPLVQGRTQAHSGRENSSGCYQEPGEATMSCPETGALIVVPPPGPSTGDLPLHSLSEASNHSESGWRANGLFGHTEQTGVTHCLNHAGGILSVVPDSPQPRLLRTEARMDVTRDGSGSHSNGLVPGRAPSQTAKAQRSNAMASLSHSLRGARKCMDNEENSSSSDDEGKLVIELESN